MSQLIMMNNARGWIASFISLTLIVSQFSFLYSQDLSLKELPLPGAMVHLSSAFEPALLKGLKIHPENPFFFDFIIDTGSRPLSAQNPRLKEESQKLIKYFLTAMTVPEKDWWVNLSPYEKDRIIAPNLGQTQMGRDMLVQDYMLKQLSASLIYPETNLGKTFWNKVYVRAQALYGTSSIPVNTFNKVWIVADKADVFERNNAVCVIGAQLKVMLEQDYVAWQHSRSSFYPSLTPIGSQILREVIIPQLTKEVNTGKNFAMLRQMFYSMILASWYKRALKRAILTKIYANQSKVKAGVNQDDPKVNEAIFQRYLQAYKRGVFNYIKEDMGPSNDQPMPRKYFSGGLRVNIDARLRVFRGQPPSDEPLASRGNLFDVAGRFNLVKAHQTRNAAMMAPTKGSSVETMLSKPLPRGKGFEDVEAVSQGREDVIRRILDNPMEDQNPLKPWIAQAFFSEKARQAQDVLAREDAKYGERAEHFRTYFSRLVKVTDNLVRSGSMSFLPNIRTGEEGYKWGPSALYSDILEELGAVNAQTGRLLNPKTLQELGLTAETKVAERWFISDDTKFPSWVLADGMAVPLFWILHQQPQAVLGQAHFAAYNEALGMVGKILDAAEPLSWQVHIGVTEAYLVAKMGDGTGLFLGVHEPKSEEERRGTIQYVKQRLTDALTAPDEKVYRMPPAGSGVEVSSLIQQNGLKGLIGGIKDSWSIPELVKYFLIEGRNVVDVGGFIFDREGVFHLEHSLAQFISPRPGDRLITEEGVPHALFGRGDLARGMFIEFKATSTGPASSRQSTADQTWALSDNLLGKSPRPGKVRQALLEEALRAIHEKGFWRQIQPVDYQHHGGEKVFIGLKGSYAVLHKEEQYAGLQYNINPEKTLRLNRFGQFSALTIRQGTLKVAALDGKVLGVYGKNEEVLIAANQGDLLLINIEKVPLEIIDFKRPVPGVSLPELVDWAQVVKGDKAALAGHVQRQGGIDLTRFNEQINIYKEGQGVDLQFDREMIQRIRHDDFEGIEFYIQTIVPIEKLSILSD